MKWKINKNFIRICFTAILLLLLFNTAVYAVPSGSKSVITPKTLKEWDNGPKVDKTIGGADNNYQINVTADTTDLKKGYYSVYLYDNTSRNIKSYDGVSFSLKNQNNMELKINLTFKVDSSTSVGLTDSSYAILETADQSITEIVKPSYGTILIPANFDGTVYVPFSKLFNSKGKNISLTHIQSWGITAVMSEGKKIKYQVGDAEFLSKSLAAIKGSYYMITLSGSSKINIPNTGSVIKSYKAAAEDLDGNPVNQPITFYLKDNTAGASITKDGKLEISSNCNSSDIAVYAKMKSSINSGELTVSLQRSSKSVSFAGIPKSSDVPKIGTDFDSALNKYINVIRAISIVIILILTGIFYEWFSESKTNYSMIKNKLYNLTDYHEGNQKL